MHLLISVEQNRNVTTGGSWGQEESSTTRHVITLLLYCEEHDKWEACQLWNTRPKHMQHANKHSTPVTAGRPALFPFSLLSFFLSNMLPSLLCCPSSLSRQALPLHFSRKSIQLQPLHPHHNREGRMWTELCDSSLFIWYTVFICALRSQH